MDDFTQYNGCLPPKQNTPLSPSEVCKTTLFHLYLCFLDDGLIFFWRPCCLFHVTKAKNYFLQQKHPKKTKTARMAEMTQVKKGHLSTKFKEKVATRESEMEV